MSLASRLSMCVLIGWLLFCSVDVLCVMSGSSLSSVSSWLRVLWLVRVYVGVHRLFSVDSAWGKVLALFREKSD